MALIELITTEPSEDYKPPHISVPGRILFEIIHVYPERLPRKLYYSDERYELEHHDYDGESGVFWMQEGIGIDYWLKAGVIELDEPGFYVLEDVSGCWIKGDGWTTDDDEEWDFALCRRATPEEIETLTLGALV